MKKKRLTLRQKRAITGLLFILPWLIGFLVYYVKSLFQTVQFSLSSIKIASTGGYTIQFIGLDNFKNALMENPDFNQRLYESMMKIITHLPFIVFFSLFMAMLLNTKFKGRALVRAIFFLPILLGSGAIFNTLQLATQAIQGGAAATVSDMQAAGGVNIDYILDLLMDYGFPISLIDTIVVLVSSVYEIVRASSVQIIIFIAALQSISPSLYEVSKIEGATAYETFWKVTFPMVSPLILTNVVYTIVDSFINSDVVNLAYQVAFGGALDYGLSSAMSVISTAVISLILVIIGGLISKFTFYYN
jgi:ABC-type sugar transport system permease subunit